MIIFLLITIFIGGVITAPIINGDKSNATSDLIEETHDSAVWSVIWDFKKNCNVNIIKCESCDYPLRIGSRTRNSCSVNMPYDSHYQYHCDSDITTVETYKNNNYCDKDGANARSTTENGTIYCECDFTNIIDHHVCVLIKYYTELHIRDENKLQLEFWKRNSIKTV